MLLTIQFPFSDARKFLDNTGILKLPGWPLPTPDSEFVRHFGSIKRRKLGGIEGWIGETEICEADRALRFCKSLEFVDSKSGIKIPFRCVFRRLYFDGWSVGKYEVGICPKKRCSISLQGWQFKEVLEHFISLPVCIKNLQGTKQLCSLLRAKKHLADLYAYATTSHEFTGELKSWWITSGTPVLFVEIEAEEHIKLPSYSKEVLFSEDDGFRLYHCLIPYEGLHLCMWVIKRSKKNLFARRNIEEKLELSINPHSTIRAVYRTRKVVEYDKARMLRICLLRLHAEHECLRIVLRNIMNKNIVVSPRTSNSDTIQQYLSNAITRIGRLEKASNKFDTEIIEVARASVDIINPGQRNSLLSTLESFDIRKNIFNKVEKFVNDWSSMSLTEVYNMGDTYNVGQAGSVGRYAHADHNTFIHSEQKQNLAEAAVEIQHLLAQLAQNHPQYTEEEVVDVVKKEIKRNPTLRLRLINAFKAGGVEALKAIFAHPLVSVPVEAIKGFLEVDAEAS